MSLVFEDGAEFCVVEKAALDGGLEDEPGALELADLAVGAAHGEGLVKGDAVVIKSFCFIYFVSQLFVLFDTKILQGRKHFLVGHGRGIYLNNLLNIFFIIAFPRLEFIDKHRCHGPQGDGIVGPCAKPLSKVKEFVQHITPL